MIQGVAHKVISAYFAQQSTLTMKNNQDYIRDIAEIRSMMERSSKFLSLAGWAGSMAGIYALLGAFISYRYFDFHPKSIYAESFSNGLAFDISPVLLTAAVVLLLAIATAIWLSTRKAKRKGERVWNATSKRMLNSMAVPLVVGGILMLILLAHGLIGLLIPLSLLFYGISLVNASRYTFSSLKLLGFAQIVLGLLASWFVEWGLVLWAAGFGLAHIIYGVYMHYRYEK